MYNWPFNFQFYSATTLACGHKQGLFLVSNEKKLLASALVVFESLVVTVQDRKETLRRSITVTSSLNAISAYCISWCKRGRRYSARPRPFLKQASGQIFKTT